MALLVYPFTLNSGEPIKDGIKRGMDAVEQMAANNEGGALIVDWTTLEVTPLTLATGIPVYPDVDLIGVSVTANPAP